MRTVSTGYVSERQRMFEERKRQSLVRQAIQESEVLRRIRLEKAEEKAQGKLLFCLWYILDQRLQSLETQRDLHTPKHCDDDWDAEFCNVIEQIPILRRACNDIWFAYACFGKKQYFNFM